MIDIFEDVKLFMMTQSKIAKLVGVSASTVSKALSGSKEISDDVRNKIIKIAVESDYFKQKTQRRLDYTSGNAVTVGLICPEIISIYYSRIITYCKNEIETRGGQAAVYIYDFDSDKFNAIIENIITKKSVDGIVVISGRDIKTNPNIPIVRMASSMQDNCYDSVSCDSYAALNAAVKHLKELGHEQIGFVGETLTEETRKQYKRALAENGISYRDELVYTINKRFEDIGTAAAREMLNSGSIPSAIIAAYDEIALALIHEFEANGISVPNDVSVIGINDIPYSSYSQVPLTTIKHYTEEQCALAVQLLYDKILGSSSSARHISLSHELVIRSSTAKNSRTSEKAR